MAKVNPPAGVTISVHKKGLLSVQAPPLYLQNFEAPYYLHDAKSLNDEQLIPLVIH
jgi:hypothetical protein